MFLMVDNVSGIEIARPYRVDSLTETQAMSISAAFDNSWSIDRIVSCDESLALLVTPPDGVGADIAFYVDMQDGDLNLSVMQDDELQLRGCYGSNIEALLSAIRSAC